MTRLSSTDAKAQSQTARVEESASAGTPLWLTGSTSALPLTSRVASGASEAKLDLFAADEKAPSDGLSLRRRLLGDANDKKDEQRDAKASAKPFERPQRTSRHHDDTDVRERAPAKAVSEAPYRALELDDPASQRKSVEAVRSQRRPSAAAMWDSLEHFSKTNRSRLPLASSDSGESVGASTETPSYVYSDSKDLGSERKPVMARASSALLADLKAKASTPYGSGLLRESKSRSTAASMAQLPTPRDDHDTSHIHDVRSTPVLPTGTRLKLEILSTWGDPHYVGLNSIELFDERGALVSFRDPERQVRACPASINELDEYSDDPRVASNLVDGVNCTCDDFHMWLAPFTLGNAHAVELELDARTSISMIRIWNYNKSRAHSYRGVRHARLLLYDTPSSSSPSAGTVIFQGEVAQALGLVSTDTIDQSCEVILFTRDDAILEAIEANDRTLLAFAQSNDEDAASNSLVANVRSSMEMQRPRTSDKKRSDTDDRGGNARVHETYDDFMRREPNNERSRLGADGRPMTTATTRAGAVRKSIDSWMTSSGEPQERSPVLEKVAETRNESDGDDEDQDSSNYDALVRGRRITIKLLSTWGDANYIGLTQLDVLVGRHGAAFPLDASHIDASPRDLATVRSLRLAVASSLIDLLSWRWLTTWCAGLCVSCAARLPWRSSDTRQGTIVRRRQQVATLGLGRMS